MRLRKHTFQEFLTAWYLRLEKTNEPHGLCLCSVLKSVRPDLAEELSNKPFNPFFNDVFVTPALEWAERQWGTK